MSPPSRTGIGSRLRTARFTFRKRRKPRPSHLSRRTCRYRPSAIITGPPSAPAVAFASFGVTRPFSTRKIDPASHASCFHGLRAGIHATAPVVFVSLSARMYHAPDTASRFGVTMRDTSVGCSPPRATTNATGLPPAICTSVCISDHVSTGRPPTDLTTSPA